MGFLRLARAGALLLQALHASMALQWNPHKTGEALEQPTLASAAAATALQPLYARQCSMFHVFACPRHTGC
jgi:hypothetical protein